MLVHAVIVQVVNKLLKHWLLECSRFDDYRKKIFDNLDNVISPF